MKSLAEIMNDRVEELSALLGERDREIEELKAERDALDIALDAERNALRLVRQERDRLKDAADELAEAVSRELSEILDPKQISLPATNRAICAYREARQGSGTDEPCPDCEGTGKVTDIGSYTYQQGRSARLINTLRKEHP